MQKLLNGVLTFRRHMFSAYRDLFERLAKGQQPEALFITCSDSRVVPNLITATDPGDLFVLRNIGNIIPPFNPDDRDNAEAAAIEYALSVLHVRDIVICGHSSCGAMKAAQHVADLESKQVKSWLRHVDPALNRLKEYDDMPPRKGARARAKVDHAPLKSPEQARTDLLSQFNVLSQLKNITSYPVAAERLESGKLQLHAWFFEIDSAQLYTYQPGENGFMQIERSLAHAPVEWSSPGDDARKTA